MRIYVLLAAVLFVTSCVHKPNKYKDGIYLGASKSKYIEEPYVGFSEIEIKQNKIVHVNFKIVDTSKNELFDQYYEKHYLGNEEYMLQCRNDWKGVVAYPKKFIAVQSLDSIDAVTGATWSYNLFKSSTSEALTKAKGK
jgi:major membrane immunogen (membrane-anchored lipoprotein)